jgi:hypothetical protein
MLEAVYLLRENRIAFFISFVSVWLGHHAFTLRNKLKAVENKAVS